jgi:lysophospholipase L1-like esterase
VRSSGLFICSVISLLLIGSCTSRLSLTSGDRIVFFGDSITELGVKPNGYVSLIRDDLRARHPEVKAEIIGAGISGNKVPDLLERLSWDVLDKAPTTVVICIGINDVWHWALKDHQGTTVDEYESGLREIVARIQYAGARVILCTPSVIGERNDGTNPQDQMLDEYSEISRNVALDLGARLCDLRKVFVEYLRGGNAENKEKGVLTYDGVHLNDAGNQLVAHEILRLIGVD